MSEQNLMIMMVKSANEDDARQANGNTILKPKDTIMVLGKRQTIREIFDEQVYDALSII